MYYKHHTKGIVLSSRVEGDDSRRANLFTENFGLISARIQGSRKTHSKLRSGSQDFSFGEFSLVHGKAGWKVVSARVDKNFFEIFKNAPTKLKIVGNIFNLIKKLVSEEVSSLAGESIFNIISNFFNFLATAKTSDIALAECLTLLRVLHTLGYMRYDPDFSIPISSLEIEVKDLETIAPKRSKIVALINESLKATNLT